MAGITLFCFHHAGSTEFVFSSWWKHLDSSVTVVGVPLEDRRASGQTIEDLAARAFEFVHGADMASTVFYGHSMGGLVAYQLCRLLDELGLGLPATVILGGSPPPGVVSDPRAALDLLEHDRGQEVVPDYLRARALEGIRRSCAYSPEPSELPVQLDLIAGGRDRLVDKDHMKLWEDFCGPTPRYHLVDGGHFFHRTATESFMSLLRGLIPCNARLVPTAAFS